MSHEEITPEQKKQLADLNLEVMELICKRLSINLGDMMTHFKNESGFIVASLKSIIMRNDLKNESELNALENQSPEC